MKLLTSIIVCLCCLVPKAQSQYQIIKEASFKIKCPCALYNNEVFKKMLDENGRKNMVAAYTCAENKDIPEKGVVYNINVFDLSDSYINISPAKYEYFDKSYMEQYATQLQNNNIEYKHTTFHGYKALEYSFNQYELPTRALLFLANKKSYLLQVGSRLAGSIKFDLLKNSFSFL